MSAARRSSATPAQHRAELLRAFGVDEDDVAANLSGRLGVGEIARMRRGVVTSVLVMVVVAAAIGTLVILVADRPIALWRYILLAVLLLAGVAVGVVRSAKLRKAIAAGEVEHHAGPVAVQSRGRAGWWLVVDGDSYAIPIRPWHIGGGHRYDVFIAPSAQLIVAMVPMDSESGP